MNGEFPVDEWTRGFFFNKPLSESSRIENVDEPSSFASLDVCDAARRIVASLNVSDSVPYCDPSCPSVRRIHWRARLPDPGPARCSGCLRRLHRSATRGDDRVYDLLRAKAAREAAE